MEPIHPQPGSTIAPDKAVGRDGVTARARRELLAGNNLIVNDPRRMGKTVWLDVLCHEPGDSFAALKIDYEGVQTASEFLLRTVTALREHASLPKQATAKLKALFENVEVAAGVVHVKVGVSTRTPNDLLGETIRSVDAHLPDDVLFVVAMDELPIAIANVAQNEGPDAAHQLLQTLRGLRRTGSRMRWIVCGSIGFHHVLRGCGATEGVVNDLVNLPLGPLEPDEARELAQRLLLGIMREGDDDAVAALIEHSGAIPHILHALAHRLHDAGSGRASAADVTAAFRDFMDDRDESRTVTHLLTRLDPFYGDRTAAAKAILDRVARATSIGSAELDADNALLDDLVDDHYLVERRGAVSWRYDVLRRIWVHRRRLT